MLLSSAGRNRMADAVASGAAFVSLHSSWPGDAGANEISGGVPAYARKAQVWGAAAGGTSNATTQPTFDVPGSTTVAFSGLWSLVTAGTFYGCAPLGGGLLKPFTAQSTSEIATTEAHGFANGTKVIVISTGGATLPTPLVEGTVYFVIGATTNTFQLALTAGGAAIDLTTDGAGFVTTIVPETFGSQGTLTISSDAISANN